MFRTRLRIPRQGLSAALGVRTSPNARRSIHQVPSLAHNYSEGVPNLMSAGGFMMAWTHQMGLMVEKLNALTAGMSDLSIAAWYIECDTVAASSSRQAHDHDMAYSP